jgi:hypothetical protein
MNCRKLILLETSQLLFQRLKGFRADFDRLIGENRESPDFSDVDLDKLL